MQATKSHPSYGIPIASGPAVSMRQSASPAPALGIGMDSLAVAGVSTKKLGIMWIGNWIITWGVLELLPDYLKANLDQDGEKAFRKKLKVTAAVGLAVTVLNNMVMPLLAAPKQEL